MTPPASPASEPAPSPPAPRLEQWADWALRGPLTALVLTACALMLAFWLPHYVTWPFWNDANDFATMAQGWATGRKLPYRDMICFNFPGQIYLFWVLGKLAGWGKTWPFFAVDAAFVVSLGPLLMLWSRRRCGAALPGAVGFLAFLAYYLNLSYDLVAQRDWEAGYFAVVGLLIAETWRGRGGRVASALAMAAGFSFRPQVVLLGPAMLLALDEGARRPGEPWGRTARAYLEWGLAFALGMALVFAPLAWAGLLRDFLDGIRVAFGGDYYKVGNHGSVRAVLRGIRLELGDGRIFPVMVALPLLAAYAGTASRRAAAAWFVALLGVLAYKPLSPMNYHTYLLHPLMLVWSVSLALVVESALGAPRSVAGGRLATVLLALAVAVPAVPRFAQIVPTYVIGKDLIQGRDLEIPPPGYARSESNFCACYYGWGVYTQVIRFLRRETGPEAEVANALDCVPALTAPAGRLSVFPTTSLTWPQVLPRDAAAYVRALEHAPADSVVVWAPDEPFPFSDHSFLSDRVKVELRPVIRRLYEPAARFGNLEVWRRKAAAGGPDSRAPVITSEPVAGRGR